MRHGHRAGENGGHCCLSPEEAGAARQLIRTVRRYVPADLLQVLLFGSKARGCARPDSDLDLLFIFRSLPPDREPQASMTEAIADEVAAAEQIPVAPWSVSLIDLELGLRTPMLVDALADGVPIWPAKRAVPRLAFTPPDALRCSGALLQRVSEGSDEVAARLAQGDFDGAARRARDDVVRLCTAALLLHGETRPRRADAVWRFIEAYVFPGLFPRHHLPVLRWAADSFGPDGNDEHRPVILEPDGIDTVGALIDRLGEWVGLRRDWLGGDLARNGNSRDSMRI